MSRATRKRRRNRGATAPLLLEDHALEQGSLIAVHLAPAVGQPVPPPVHVLIERVDGRAREVHGYTMAVPARPGDPAEPRVHVRVCLDHVRCSWLAEDVGIVQLRPDLRSVEPGEGATDAA